jgi:hypothetical protein
MKKSDNIVVIIDGDIRGAEVVDILPNGDIVTSVKDYYGDYVGFPRGKVFTVSEWEQVKGEYA